MTYKYQLLVLVPSRGRPENIRRLLKGIDETQTHATFRVLVDLDDPKLDEYQRVMQGNYKASLYVGERAPISALLNFHAKIDAEYYRAIGFMGDDHLPKTKYWDALIAGTLGKPEDLPRIAYANDLLQGRNLPTQVFIDSRIIKALGRMVPETMDHLYLDNYWKALGEQLGTLHYLDNVVIEHLHPVAGKADMDEGYSRVNSDSMYDRDYRAWQLFINTGRLENDVLRIKEAHLAEQAARIGL